MDNETSRPGDSRRERLRREGFPSVSQQSQQKKKDQDLTGQVGPSSAYDTRTRNSSFRYDQPGKPLISAPSWIGQKSPNVPHRATQTNIPVVPVQKKLNIKTAKRQTQVSGSTPVWLATWHPHNWHLALWIGMGMLTMLIGWVLLSFAGNWWQITQVNWQEGYPRSFQIDARVGHNDTQYPSHFIAINLKGQTEIIEFPGGDSTKARVYVGPNFIGQNNDLAPVSLSFKDMNGDGKPDMILDVMGNKYIFQNKGAEFDQHYSSG